jgi:tetratricopeptide (TPR) repeat protein
LALGAFQDAAADCEALLRRRDELAEGPWKAWDCADFIVSRLYKLAVDSYEADGRIDRAITASDRWMREFPAQPGIHECRARLFQQQGDLDSAYESLRKEVASNPPRGEKPAISMALRFGELYGTPEVQLKRFRRNLDLNEIDLVRSLVGIHWPKARALDDPNSKDWINGCSLLLKRVPDDPSLAVFLFGRVAENHLRTRLFERFRATLGVEITSSIPSEEQDPITNYVRHGTRGHISLEQMLNEIRHPEARSAVGRRFREWLRREKNARFLQQIDLKALGDLNNRAKHKRESLLTWRDAEDMARLSREVLDVLLLM